MPWIRDRAVAYHQQNTSTYCGPAVAMMILNSLDGQVIQQEDLAQIVHRPNGPWETYPDDLARGLNTWAPPDLKGTFAVVPSGDELGGTQAIVEALHVLDGPAPAALVFGNGHWVVVTDANVAETQPQFGVSGMAVNGFFINSPSVTPCVPAERHANGDLCGSALEFGSLYVNQYVSYEAWKNDYFTGYPENGELKFATVCSDQRFRVPPLSKERGRFRASPTFSQLSLVASPYVEPAIAQRQALYAIAKHGLDQSGPLRDVLYDLDQLVPGTPELVARIDIINSHYYLIPLLRDGDVTALARMHAFNGAFMGVSQVLGGKFEFKTTAVLEREVRAGVTVAPKLLWRPCRESASPFDAFHHLIAAQGVYRSLSGRFFDAVTPLGQGG